jgi:hypothetical protein
MVTAQATGTVVVGCGKCNGGYIEKWADDGDAENGPDPYVVAWDSCDCAAGLIARELIDAENEAWREGYIGSRMEQSGRSREEVLKEIEAEERHSERTFWMEVCGLDQEDVMEIGTEVETGRLTVEDAKTLRGGETLHYTGRHECTRTVGPRGGVTENITRVRVSGMVKTWKTDPGRIRVPVKYGLYESSAIEAHNVGDFHREGDCPPNREG